MGAVVVAAAWATAAASAFDLTRTGVERLENGLTVLALEERALPLVSVQMLYRVGARDEVTGATGLAHFVEHMAFRASEGFPGTELVGRIYAVGGEWHGYTWIDQTTYFETVPVEELDLALAIEADRMTRLLLPAAEVEAERGAVLAELHGYENDPATVLKDAVVATSFLQHPYRHNTIGWTSEVERITHADVAAFYRRHYVPANAVLAVVGAVDPADVVRRVRERFGGLAAGRPSPLPRTVEPPQRGERRVTLRLPAGAGRFEIAYRAPAAAHPDYPAFLLLRELLGGTGGVNFLQDTFGTAVGEETRLAGAAEELSTWHPPSAQPYVFTIAGLAGGASPPEVEAAIESRLAPLRRAAVEESELAAARDRLLGELVFDLETTEDAAHQLAFFEGLGALEVLLGLPERLNGVTPDEVRRVAAAYLRPEQRTVGWIAEAAPAAEAGAETGREPASKPPPERSRVPAASTPAGGDEAIGPAVRWRLPAGLPVVFQRSPLSRSGYLLLLLPKTACELGGRTRTDDPVWRHTAAGFPFLAGEAAATLRRARSLMDSCAGVGAATGAGPPRRSPGTPEEALANALSEGLGVAEPPAAAAAPVLLALTGALEEGEARRLTAAVFGDLAPGPSPAGPEPSVSGADKRLRLPHAVQARLGYAVPAPSPGAPDGAAWRMLLYILSHDYEGRLGVEAIGRRGLVYFIGSDYHCDGRSGWISLATGVDPGKLEPMRELFEATLAGLAAAPPTEAELAEARSHLLGRRRTAAQSNSELASRLARDTICFGAPLSVADQRRRLDGVRVEDLRRIVPAFTAGVRVTVE